MHGQQNIKKKRTMPVLFVDTRKITQFVYAICKEFVYCDMLRDASYEGSQSMGF